MKIIGELTTNKIKSSTRKPKKIALKKPPTIKVKKPKKLSFKLIEIKIPKIKLAKEKKPKTVAQLLRSVLLISLFTLRVYGNNF